MTELGGNGVIDQDTQKEIEVAEDENVDLDGEDGEEDDIDEEDEDEEDEEDNDEG